MKLDTDTVLKDPKGKPFQPDPTMAWVFEKLDGKPASMPVGEALELLQKEYTKDTAVPPQTFADSAYSVLMDTKEAHEAKGSEKRDRYKLAAKILQGGLVDVSETELELLQGALEKHLGPKALYACDKVINDARAAESKETKMLTSEGQEAAQ